MQLLEYAQNSSQKKQKAGQSNACNTCGQFGLADGSLCGRTNIPVTKTDLPLGSILFAENRPRKIQAAYAINNPSTANRSIMPGCANSEENNFFLFSVSFACPTRPRHSQHSVCVGPCETPFLVAICPAKNHQNSSRHQKKSDPTQNN
jgi:hypothetical protein